MSILAPIPLTFVYFSYLVFKFQRSFHHFLQILVAVFLLIYHVVWLAQPCSADANLDPSWIDPHAWSTEAPELMKLNPRCTPCQACDQSAKAEYFRLVQSLFNPDEFRVSNIYGQCTLILFTNREQTLILVTHVLCFSCLFLLF